MGLRGTIILKTRLKESPPPHVKFQMKIGCINTEAPLSGDLVPRKENNLEGAAMSMDLEGDVPIDIRGPMIDEVFMIQTLIRTVIKITARELTMHIITES